MVYCFVKINEKDDEMDKIMNRNNKTNDYRCNCNNSPPVNLLEIIEDRDLIHLVIEATTEVSAKGLVRRVNSIPDWVPHNMVLSLMTYAYATCRYSSEQLAESVRKDPALRYLSSGIFPDASTFIKFRRANAHTIVYTLNNVLEKVKGLCSNKAASIKTNSGIGLTGIIKNRNCELAIDGEKRLGLAVMNDCLERDV